MIDETTPAAMPATEAPVAAEPVVEAVAAEEKKEEVADEAAA